MNMGMIKAALLSRSAIPPQYQRVEYLQNSLGAYIDMEYIPLDKTRYELEAMFISASNNIGNGIGSGFNNSRFAIGTSGGNIGYVWFGIYDANVEANSTSWMWTMNEKFKAFIDRKRKTYGFNGQQKSFTNSYRPTTASMVIFARRQNNYTVDMNESRRIYSAKLFEDDIPVRNLIPCRRKSDNVAGMWDTVSKRFFTNAGVGNFTAGPDVI